MQHIYVCLTEFPTDSRSPMVSMQGFKNEHHALKYCKDDIEISKAGDNTKNIEKVFYHYHTSEGKYVKDVIGYSLFSHTGECVRMSTIVPINITD